MTTTLKTSIAEVNLRFATKADTALILEFIKALAEFENLSHEVAADEASLHESLFGDRKYAEVIVAEYLGKPAGSALYFHNYSTFLGKPGIYLEDLYVKPEFRQKGVGSQLFACLARIAVERSCGRFEWSVLDWNENAIEFYEGIGGQAMDEWTVFRVTGDSLLRLAGT